jgi:hypothetical protein
VSNKSRRSGKPKSNSAAMVARWGPPRFWRGRKLELLGARDDAPAVQAWAEFERRRDGDDG